MSWQKAIHIEAGRWLEGRFGPARRETAVEPRPLAVRVDDLDAVLPDEPHREGQVPHPKAAQGQLDDGETAHVRDYYRTAKL